MYWKIRDALDNGPPFHLERTREVLEQTLQFYAWAVKGGNPPK
jgi:hypothetical protein